MRWEKVVAEGGIGDGPGRRWGHTINSIRGGRLLYVFGGYGQQNCQTNQVHVFDTVNRTWNEPVMKGTLPTPRDSHSCTTVGDNLFIFGGTDGRNPLNDLHILDTSSNTWISPSVRGDGPEAREGHSAALIGKRLFIFGGCGKFEDNEIYYDDLYILNTETFLWKRVVPSGTPPSKRDSHTCSSWKNKIIVIGGEDSCSYYLSDIHILDADTLVWCKLNTTGQLLPPRAGHTTIAFGKNLFVFGGFSDEQNLYDDVYMLDIEYATWTKVKATGAGPSARFSMAGEILDPLLGGVLIFMGGCNKNLEALDDMYYLHTGLTREIERDQRRLEKLSLRKQLKLKCQEQHTVIPEYDDTVYHPMPISTYYQPGRQNISFNEHLTSGKRTFEAKVTKSIQNGFTIETVIDGKTLRGILVSNKPIFMNTAGAEPNGKRESMDVHDVKLNEDPSFTPEITRPVESNIRDCGQADGIHGNLTASEDRNSVSATDIKNPVSFGAATRQEVQGALNQSMACDLNLESNGTNDVLHSGAEITKENVSAAKELVTPPSS